MEHKFDIDPKLIDDLAKSIKTEKDLAALSKHLLKLTVERAMNAELDAQDRLNDTGSYTEIFTGSLKGV